MKNNIAKALLITGTTVFTFYIHIENLFLKAGNSQYLLFAFLIIQFVSILLLFGESSQEEKPDYKIVKAKDPNSKYLTHNKEYKVEWQSTEGYYAVRNDVGRIRPYAPVNFYDSYKPSKRP